MEQGPVIDKVRHHATQDKQELEEADEKAADRTGRVFRDVCGCQHSPSTKTNAFEESANLISHPLPFEKMGIPYRPM